MIESNGRELIAEIARRVASPVRPNLTIVGGSRKNPDLERAPFTGREAANRDNTPIDPERDNS